MNRRTVLAMTGTSTSVALSGCLTDLIRRTDGNGPDGLAMGETATFDDGTELTLSNPRVQKTAFVFEEWYGLARDDGFQYVVVDVDAPDFWPREVHLEHDGTFEEPAERPVFELDQAELGVPVAVDAPDVDGIGCGPAADPEAVWKLDEEIVAAIPEVPDLRLRDATIVDHDGDLGIEFEIENVSDVDGVFRALVAPDPGDIADIQRPVEVAAPAGEMVTETVSPPDVRNYDPEEMTFQSEPDEDTRRFTVVRS